MSPRALVLSGGLALLALLVAAGGARAETVVNGGTISADTTWTLAESPFLVKGTITVLGTSGPDGVTTLTIEPGVEVRFHAGTSLIVSGTSSANRGALDARGTELSPILFTSNQTVKTRGSWSGIVLQPFSNDTLTFLENVTVEYAGSSGNVHVNQAEPTIRNAIFRESSTHGMQLSNSHVRIENAQFLFNTDTGLLTATGFPTVTASTFANNGKYGLSTTSGVPTLVAPTFDANGFRPARLHVETSISDAVFRNTATHEIELTASPNNTLPRDRTFVRHTDDVTSNPLAYVVTGSFSVIGQDGPDLLTTLTIEPGVELRFHANIALTIAGSSTNQFGALDARGTASLPILFTSNQTVKTRGFWSGIAFNNHASDTATFIEHVVVEYAANNFNVASASFPIRDSTFREASSTGLLITTSTSTLERLVLTSNAVDGAALTTFTGSLVDSTVSNNGRHGIFVTGDATFQGLTVANNGQYGIQSTSGRLTLQTIAFDNNGNRPLRTHVDSTTGGLAFHASQVPEIEFHASPTASVARDQTWTRYEDTLNGTPHRYAVLSSFTVQGTDGPDGVTTLTIPPGVEARFSSSVALAVGTNSASLPGALDARGTIAQPILLTSNQVVKTRGAWNGISFANFASDSLSAIENATIEYGGSNGNLLFSSATVPVKRVHVHNASGPGISISTGNGPLEEITSVDNTGNGLTLATFNGVVTDATLARNGQHGMTLTGVGAELVRVVASQNAFYGIQITSGSHRIDTPQLAGNGQRPLRMHVESELLAPILDANGILEVELISTPTSTLTKDRTLPVLVDASNGTGHTYIVLAGFTIQGTDGPDAVTTLTIEPGAQLRFAAGAGITVGTSTIPGALDARGTQAAPIVFAPNQLVKTPGFWSGITFNNAASDELSRVENVSVSHGGSNGNLHLVNTAIPIVNVVAHNASGPGIQVATGAGALRHVVSVDNAGSGLVLSTYTGSVEDATLSRNGQHGLTLSGTNVLLHDLDVSHNALYGIQITSGIHTLDNVTLAHNGQRPLRMHVESALSGTTFSGNGIAEIELIAGPTNTLTQTRTLAVHVDTVSATAHPYVVLSTFTIQGPAAKLTIDPGAQLRFAAGTSIAVGTSTLNGALDAAGTTSAPILLTANQGVKTRGFWGGISLANGASDADTRFENLTIEYATTSLTLTSANPTVRNVVLRQGTGSGLSVTTSSTTLTNLTIQDHFGAGLTGSFSGTIDQCLVTNNSLSGISLSTSATIVGCTVSANAHYGIHTTAGVLTLTDVAIVNNLGAPLRMHVESLLTNVSFSGNGADRIELHGGTLASDRTFARHVDVATSNAIPYVVNQTFTVVGTAGPDGVTTLTIEPGVTLRFNLATALTIAGTGANVGALDAAGTSALPIVLTANQPVPTRGFWGPLALSASTDDARTRLENLTVEYGGRTTGAIVLTATEVSLRNVQLRENANVGIHVNGGYVRIEDTVVRDTTSHGVNVVAGGAALWNTSIETSGGKAIRATIDLDLRNVGLQSNAAPDIEIIPSSGSRDARWPLILDNLTATPIPYNVTGSVTIGGVSGPDGIATHTLDPGVTVRMANAASFSVGVSAGAPGALDARATAAQPILFTSNQATPTPASWRSIEFNDFAADGASTLENVTVEYGGASSTGGIHIARSLPTVRNSVINATGVYGIFVTAVPAGLVLEGNHISNVTFGIHVAGGSQAFHLVGNYVAAGTPLSLASASNGFVERNQFHSISGGSSVASGSVANRIWDNVFTRPTGAPLFVNQTGNLFNRTPTPGTTILGGPVLGGNSYSDYAGIDWTNPSDGLGDSPSPYAIAGSAGANDPHPLVAESAWIPDTDLPTTVLNVTGPILPSGWYNGTARIRLDATDATSGVAFLTRTLDNVTNSSAGNPIFINVSAQGWHVLDHFATDRATNVEPTQRFEFGVDSIAPTLALSLAPRLDDLCWVGTAHDAGSGIASLTYTVTRANDTIVTNGTGVPLDNITFTSGIETCADLDEDGSFRVTARTADHAGHRRDNRTALLTLDIRAPEIDLARPEAGAAYVGNSRLATPFGAEANAALVVLGVEVVANATDEGSGVARIDLYLDGVLIASDTHAPLRVWLGDDVPAGRHTLRVVAIDGAGHEAAIERDVVFATTIPPEIAAAEATLSVDPPRPAEARVATRRDGEDVSNNP